MSTQGPVLSTRDCTSASICLDMFTGKTPVVPHLGFGARAHTLAGFGRVWVELMHLNGNAFACHANCDAANCYSSSKAHLTHTRPFDCIRVSAGR